MHPRHALGTSLYFIGKKLRTFEELVICAYDMESSIFNKGTKVFLIYEVKKGKNEINDNRKIANSVINEFISRVSIEVFLQKKRNKLKESMMAK